MTGRTTIRTPKGVQVPDGRYLSKLLPYLRTERTLLRTFRTHSYHEPLAYRIQYCMKPHSIHCTREARNPDVTELSRVCGASLRVFKLSSVAHPLPIPLCLLFQVTTKSTPAPAGAERHATRSRVRLWGVIDVLEYVNIRSTTTAMLFIFL
jgi:hypothetical protein